MRGIFNRLMKLMAEDSGGSSSATVYTAAGSLVNATGNYVNAYTGETTAFDTTNTLAPGMKTFYDTNMLENSRPKRVYHQLGRSQSLPRNHGMTVEWRKWNTLPDLEKLTEGVIPAGTKFGETSMVVSLSEYGRYVAITRQLDLHHVDNVIVGATEELGSAAIKTFEKYIRTELMKNTNVMYADVLKDAAYVSTPSSRAALQTALATAGNVAYLTPDMVNQAVTKLEKDDVPTFDDGKYVAVIHPSCAYDLRQSKDWVEAHKYASPDEIYNGEIGELHGVRFIRSSLAPVVKGTSDTYAIYPVMFFGKDAFAVVDPEGAGMETIVKPADKVGGPLNQFSTVGVKGSMAAKVLYPERLLIVECSSKYSKTDAAN